MTLKIQQWKIKFS